MKNFCLLKLINYKTTNDWGDYYIKLMESEKLSSDQKHDIDSFFDDVVSNPFKQLEFDCFNKFVQDLLKRNVRLNYDPWKYEYNTRSKRIIKRIKVENSEKGLYKIELDHHAITFVVMKDLLYVLTKETVPYNGRRT